jgi:predicted metal-dependent phosphoesterase TrpH
MKADLHVHSTASDGTLSPSQVVDRAHALGVGVLAISDHDSVEGIPEAAERCVGLGMTLIPAVELSAVQNGRDVHVLAYFVDPTSPDLAEQLSALRAARRARAEEIVAALRAAGHTISLDDVLAMANGGAVGRSHVARTLVEAGHADTIEQAFERFIGRGRPFYVAKRSAHPAEVVAGIARLGAVPVLAHPGVTGVDDLIEPLVEAGLLGIEAYHADHTPLQAERYAALARGLGLLITGGSDFHGPQAPNPDIGATALPEADLRAFLAADPRA